MEKKGKGLDFFIIQQNFNLIFCFDDMSRWIKLDFERVGLNIKIHMGIGRKDFISSPEDGAKKKQKEYRFLNVSFHSTKS